MTRNTQNDSTLPLLLWRQIGVGFVALVNPEGFQFPVWYLRKKTLYRETIFLSRRLSFYVPLIHKYWQRWSQSYMRWWGGVSPESALRPRPKFGMSCAVYTSHTLLAQLSIPVEYSSFLGFTGFYSNNWRVADTLGWSIVFGTYCNKDSRLLNLS